MTNLERAKAKAERLQKEQSEAWNAGMEESRKIPFGQPNIIGRGDIYKNAKRNWEKSRKLAIELEAQENRVEMLEKVEEFKTDNELLKDVHVVGKTAYAHVGAKTSVNNIDYFKNKLNELEQANAVAKEKNKNRQAGERKHKTYGAEITKLKNKIQYLETLQEKAEKCENAMSDKTIELIESGQVNQWKKQPIYYFVQGLRKVALVINEENGNFEIASKYPPKNEEEKQFVLDLLG